MLFRRQLVRPVDWFDFFHAQQQSRPGMLSYEIFYDMLILTPDRTVAGIA
jgi:hypothetical protein